MSINFIKFVDDNHSIEEIKNELKKNFKIKTVNFHPKGGKEMKPLVKIEQLSMGLKIIRKIFIENFTEIIKKNNSDGLKYKLLYKLENLEVNFYKPKTEVLKDKSGKIIINISSPINDEFLVKLIKSKINFFEKNEEEEIQQDAKKANKFSNLKT